MEEQPKVDPYLPAQAPEGEGQKNPMTQEQTNSLEMFISLLSKVIHGPKTRDAVTDILTSTEDPFMTLPMAANQANESAVALAKKSGQEVGFDIQLAASSFLMNDLIHLGYAAAGWDELDENDIAELYEDTIQMTIEKGLKSGAIDPIQLQLEVEPLMDEDQQRAGQHFAQKGGLNSQPSNASMNKQQMIQNDRKNTATNKEAIAKDRLTQSQPVASKAALGGPQG